VNATSNCYWLESSCCQQSAKYVGDDVYDENQIACNLFSSFAQCTKRNRNMGYSITGNAQNVSIPPYNAGNDKCVLALYAVRGCGPSAVSAALGYRYLRRSSRSSTRNLQVSTSNIDETPNLHST